MKLFRRLFSGFLLIFCIITGAMPVKASALQEYEGLQVTVATDQETYEEGESITATITVLNTNSQSVTVVNLEQLIPEGYVLSEDSDVSTQNVEIRPGQSIELQVTFQGASEDAGEDSIWDTILYGETLGIPNLILIVFGVIFFIIFMVLT